MVSLDRPMRRLQQRVTRGVSSRRRVHGPLRQWRYRCKLVEIQRHLDQLLVFIHPNPVSAGVVDEPADYLSSQGAPSRDRRTMAEWRDWHRSGPFGGIA